jgi:hypothetical protein
VMLEYDVAYLESNIYFLVVSVAIVSFFLLN